MFEIILILTVVVGIFFYIEERRSDNARRKIVCERCLGEGFLEDDKVCPECNGKGYK